jgi:hypothetical protein
MSKTIVAVGIISFAAGVGALQFGKLLSTSAPVPTAAPPAAATPVVARKKAGRVECLKDAAVLERAARYVEEAAERLRPVPDGNLFSAVNAAEGYRGELEDMLYITECATDAKKAYEEYRDALVLYVDGEKHPSWKEHVPPEMMAGARRTRKESADAAKAKLRVELDRLKRLS